NFGHLQAEVDPLKLRGPAVGTKFVRAEDKQWPDQVKKLLQENQMTAMNEMFLLPNDSSIGKPNEQTLPLGEILNRLQNAYCRFIGVEYMHIPSPEKRKWIRDQFEPGVKVLTTADKKRVWKHLLESGSFEQFLTRKWPTTFRFSLEGCEILVPALQQVLHRCAESGTTNLVLGMAHRGRLNVMANILQKEIEKLLIHFKRDVDFGKLIGDVKYHLGCYITQKHERTNKDMTICIVSNASHLESVNPIVQGRCKAEQIILNDKDGKKVIPIVVHGDAAYAGQGVVYENNTLCNLPDYNVHGTLHIVINNNIGFTTSPEESRSSPYCTDVAKIVNAPVFHVNSEKPDEVMHCMNVACAYRNLYHQDVVVDLICYRRYGHNEADEPAYTSPILYSHVRKHVPFPDTYTKQLLTEKVITQEDIEKEKKIYFAKCDEAFAKSQKYTTIDWKDWNDSPWKDFATGVKNELMPTGVPEDELKKIGLQSMAVPQGFVIHKLLGRVFQNRKKMIESRSLDWSLGETLAYGTLLEEGIPIRLAGQDAQRGTFSHRHHLLHHQEKDNEKYMPLNHLSPKQAKYNVVNTPLIEYGALGFEMGFAMSFGNALVVYEAQYGDFLNNAQLIIDAYLSGGESKWGRQCGLVILLPHGLEGLGSEHSSARLERFLQMSSENPDLVSIMNEPNFPFNQLKRTNWIVANCTTPANFFHILRRQMKLPFRKPLIIMSPKSLLRHPECKSSFDELIGNTSFQSVIPELGPASKSPDSVKKHIICSGKVFYDLIEKRKKQNLDSSIAITRIEQISPFPFNYVANEINKYPNAEICWVQEEHKNQGPWSFVFDRFNALLNDTNWYALTYVGRGVSPVPAVSTVHKHNIEREEFLDAAMVISEDLEGRGISKKKFHPRKKQ
ncbi:Probable 2-oxoglutarate dehydrogenase E1 component DHKTD1 homolog, mitochondrial, partial [Gryllus bimaculatus]